MVTEAMAVAMSLWGRSGRSLVNGFVSKMRRTSIVRAVVTPINRAFKKNALNMVIARKLNTGLKAIYMCGEKRIAGP